MIVKNEEKYLDACLASVSSICNELIVVDTGSKDKTIDIANKHGAKIYQYTWKNDFADARNVSISKAANPWILQLDADEEVLPESYKWFKETYPWPNVDGYNVKLHNLRDESSDEVMMIHKLIRFYRNKPEIQYHFAIHENILIPSQKMELSDIHLLHKGYGSELNNRDKSVRNYNILKEKIKEEPYNPYNFYYISQCYGYLGESDNLKKAAKKSLQLGVSYPTRAHVLRILYNHAINQRDSSIIEEISQTIPNESVFPEILYYQAQYEHVKGNHQAGYELFTEFLEFCERSENSGKIGDERFILKMTMVNTLVNLATYDINKGNITLAVSRLYHALELSPTSLHIYTLIGKCEMMLKHFDKARYIMEKAIKQLKSQQSNLRQKDLLDNYKSMLTKISQLN